MSGDLATHLVSAPVPGGHDGQAKGHPSPREVPCVGVSEHVHGVCPRQVAGRVGDGPGRDGPGVGCCQLLIPTNLLESWSGRGGTGRSAAGGLLPPPLSSSHK